MILSSCADRGSELNGELCNEPPRIGSCARQIAACEFCRRIIPFHHIAKGLPSFAPSREKTLAWDWCQLRGGDALLTLASLVVVMLVSPVPALALRLNQTI